MLHWVSVEQEANQKVYRYSLVVEMKRVSGSVNDVIRMVWGGVVEQNPPTVIKNKLFLKWNQVSINAVRPVDINCHVCICLETGGSVLGRRQPPSKHTAARLHSYFSHPPGIYQESFWMICFHA